MEYKFISHKPWVDETVGLRKALFFTTIFMVLLGVILGVLGIVLLAYMEFVVGVISLVFAVLLPLGYVGANIALFAKRRREFDKNMVIEYCFTEDELIITKVSDNYKAKNIISYVNLKLNKVYNKSRFIMLKTRNYYNDMIALRKADILVNEGENKNQVIVNFINFLLAKLAESMIEPEIMTADDASEVMFEDLAEKDVNTDIEDERQDADDEAVNVKFEVKEESNPDLFNYGEQLIEEEEPPAKVEEKDDSFLYEYSYNEENNDDEDDDK